MIAQGLPGTHHDKMLVFVRHLFQLRPILRTGQCATTAGDNGAINIWIDDDGWYRCEAYRHLIVIEAKAYTSMEDVKKWFKIWRKKIQ